MGCLLAAGRRGLVMKWSGPDSGVSMPPVGTRGEGKHTSKVLAKVHQAVAEGASLDEACEAFYEEYSGRKVSDEKSEADYRRHCETINGMKKKLKVDSTK
jgi:hypothetical protein